MRWSSVCATSDRHSPDPGCTAVSENASFRGTQRLPEEAADRGRRCHPVHNALIQPLDPRWLEERHRRGQPAPGQELVRAQAVGDHRYFPAAIGTAIAQQSLCSVLRFCNSPLMNAIEAYIQFTPDLIDDGGQVNNDSTAGFLRNYMMEFSAFITRVKTALA